MVQYSNLYNNALDERKQAYWSIDVDDGAVVERFTEHIRFLEWESITNEMSSLRFRISREPDNPLDEGYDVTLLADNSPEWMGFVSDIKQITGTEYEVICYGPSKKLAQREDNFTLKDSYYAYALSRVVGDDIRVNALTNFEQKTYFGGRITLDDDQDSPFDVLNRAVEELGGEWFVTLREFTEESNSSSENSSPSTVSGAAFGVDVNQESIIHEVGFELAYPAKVKATVFKNGNPVASKEKNVQANNEWVTIKLTEWDYIDESTETTDPELAVTSSDVVSVELETTDYEETSYSGDPLKVGSDSGTFNLYNYDNTSVPVHSSSSGGNVLTVRDVSSSPNSNVDSEVHPAMNVVIPDYPSEVDKTYGFDTDPNNAETITNMERNEEVYDQVIVKANSSGESQDRGVYPDPNVDSHPDLPPDPNTLVVPLKATKGILSSESQGSFGLFDNNNYDPVFDFPALDAQLSAQNIYEQRKNEWREIVIVPVNKQFVHDFEEHLEVVDGSNNYTADARVIGRRHIFDPYNLENDIDGTDYQEILCDSKPPNFVRDVANSERRFKEAESYGQAHRNTILEESQEIVDAGDGGEVRVTFDVPTRFTQDAVGRDRVLSATLDITNDKYPSIIDPNKLSEDNYVNTETSTFDTTVLNHGDLEEVYTDQDQFANADIVETEEGAELAGSSSIIETAGDDASLGSVESGRFHDLNGFNTSSTVDDVQGMFVQITASVKPDSTVDYFHGVPSGHALVLRDKVNSVDVPIDGGILVITNHSKYVDTVDFSNEVTTDDSTYSTISALIYYPKNVTNINNSNGDDFKVRYKGAEYTDINGNAQDWIVDSSFTYWTIKEHAHTLSEILDGVDNAQAYTTNGGDNIDASVNASQGTDDIVNNSTNLIETVQSSDELTYALTDTTIDTVDVIVENSNGSTTVGTFDVQPGGDGAGSKTNINISQDIVTSGRNIVRIIPNQGRGKLSGRVFLDHALDTRTRVNQ